MEIKTTSPHETFANAERKIGIKKADNRENEALPANRGTDFRDKETFDRKDKTQASSTLSFSYDKDIRRVIVKIMDGESEEVLKQIPAEEMIRLSKALSEQENVKNANLPLGMLIDKTA